MLNALECNEYSALCLLYISIAAPDQRPMIRCQRIHRESRPWDFFWPGASVPEKTQSAACGGRGKTRAATFPYHCAASPTPIPSQEQAVFVQDDVGIRMEGKGDRTKSQMILSQKTKSQKRKVKCKKSKRIKVNWQEVKTDKSQNDKKSKAKSQNNKKSTRRKVKNAKGQK